MSATRSPAIASTSGLRGLVLATALLPASLAAGGAPVFWLGGGGAPCNFGSLATAIGAAPDGAIINIANNQTYDDINVTIHNKSLRLTGGWADCAGTPSPDPAVLTGQAGANLPVLRLQTGATPREIELRRLHVRGGTRSGIEVAGAMSVYIFDSIVSDSQANNGGGINVIGESPSLTRVRVISSVIGRTQDGPENGNHAFSAGGGLRCVDARISLSRAEFRGNTSEQFGGGVSLNGCDMELLNLIELPIIEGAGGSLLAVSRFEDNQGAFFGGALHAWNGSEVDFEGLFDRIVIDGNTSSRGAGVYLAGAGTRLVGRRVSITNNTSDAFGAGVYAEDGAHFSLVRGGDLYGICDPLAICNRIAGNAITMPFTVAGSAVHIHQASLNLDQVEVTGNTALVFNQSTLHISGDSIARITNSLIHGNDAGAGWLMHMDGPDSTVNITASTIAGNDTAEPLIRVDSGDNESTLGLRNGIIWEPGTTIVDAGDNDTLVSLCMNAHESVSITAQTHDPGFKSAADGDYRLRLDSPNLDACADPFAGADAFDLVGVERPQDLGFGGGATPYDRGAFEQTDLIFANGFQPLPPPF